MAETSSQQCLSALCNAGDSVSLRSLDDHSRRIKVSMIWVRELQRNWKYLYLLVSVHGDRGTDSLGGVRSKGVGMSGQGFTSGVHLMTRHNHMSHRRLRAWESLRGELGDHRFTWELVSEVRKQGGASNPDHAAVVYVHHVDHLEFQFT